MTQHPRFMKLGDALEIVLSLAEKQATTKEQKLAIDVVTDWGTNHLEE